MRNLASKINPESAVETSVLIQKPSRVFPVTGAVFRYVRPVFRYGR